MIAAMLLHVSAAFEKKFRCPVSFADERPAQSGRVDAWSCHFVRFGRRETVMAMHDATLFTLILPTAGVKGYDDFLKRIIERIADAWARHGLAFDKNDQTVMVLRRSDKSRIGTMTDAIKMIRFYAEIAKLDGVEVDLTDMEQRCNKTPYKTLGYDSPLRRLRALRDQL